MLDIGFWYMVRNDFYMIRNENYENNKWTQSPIKQELIIKDSKTLGDWVYIGNGCVYYRFLGVCN